MELVNIGSTNEREFQEKVAELLAKRPDDLVKNFCRLITHGEDKCSRSKFVIDYLQAMKKLQILDKHMCTCATRNKTDEDNEGQTVLHSAAIFHTCEKLVLRIASSFPGLTSAQRTGQFEGENFLHILIAKGACQTAIKFLHLDGVDESKKRVCVEAKATGSIFANTILMGETVLSVAALNFNKELFEVLITFGASVHDRNSKDETVLHTLIRYVNANKQYLDKTLDFLGFLHKLMLERNDSPERHDWGIKYTKKVWFIENDKHQTALQLAACLGEDKIFMYIMNLQWVYCVLNDYDGLFENKKYDITEVDTLTKLKWLRQRRDAVRQRRDAVTLDASNTSSQLGPCSCFEDARLMRKSSPAILDTVWLLDINAACRIIRSPALQTLIDDKWKHYKKYFILWGFLHFFIGCITLSTYAHYKILYSNWLSDEPTTTHMIQTVNDTTEKSFIKPPISQSRRLFVMICCGTVFGLALPAFSLEFIRTVVQRRPWKPQLLHHNGMYRLIHLLLYFFLFVDSTWFFISPSTNPSALIILAVLLSWCFLIFFLRPWKMLSFYTVMLQRVLIGDMLRFSAFILLELVSFTVVMQLLFLRNQPIPDEFRDVPHSLLTMFKLMLGLEDFDILSQADPVWLAIPLFVTYVLITYVLLMNSLIAMMTNTCSATELDKTNIWQVQRLSVVLFMEHLLMIFGRAKSLDANYTTEFGNQQNSNGVVGRSQSPASTPPATRRTGCGLLLLLCKMLRRKDRVDRRFLEMPELGDGADGGQMEMQMLEAEDDGGLFETPEGEDGTDRGLLGTPEGEDGTDRGLLGTPEGEDGTDRGLLGTPEGEDGTDRGLLGTPVGEDRVDGRSLEPDIYIGTRYVIEVSQGLTPSERGADLATRRRYIREDF